MSGSSKSYLTLTPILGLVLYVIIYTLGAADYTGGSFNYPNSQNYSFSHNLLCDLMLPNSINGQINDGRTLGIISHVILSATMMGFFYILSKIFTIENRNTQLTRYFGIASMFVFSFMFTEHHDAVVLLTGIIGTMALIPFFLELKTYNDRPLKVYSFFCFFLSIVVFISFISKIGYYYLPFLQKITFVIDAIWVVWICRLVYRNKQPSLAVF
ncbi:MAG: hypothetical protein ACJA01_003280 [Saprospiraceae bacterium]|jgi:hypothetical protein